MIMKLTICVLLFFMIGITTMAQTNDSNVAAAKDTLVKDPLSQQPMLLGYCSRQAFQDTSFSWWFNSVYDMYEVDSASAEILKDKLKDVNITIVMGTWCSDSRREVPKLFKILDQLKFPSDKISIITVGRDRKGRGSETDNLKIELVPTIIFYRNGSEIGRIVESPKISLEKDMLKILEG